VFSVMADVIPVLAPTTPSYHGFRLCCVASCANLYESQKLVSMFCSC
jgi:hypothetical protein